MTRPGRATGPDDGHDDRGGGVGGLPHRRLAGASPDAARCPDRSDRGGVDPRPVQPGPGDQHEGGGQAGDPQRARAEPARVPARGRLGAAVPAQSGGTRSRLVRVADRRGHHRVVRSPPSHAPSARRVRTSESSSRHPAAGPGAALLQQRPQARADDVGVVAAAGGEAHRTDVRERPSRRDRLRGGSVDRGRYLWTTRGDPRDGSGQGAAACAAQPPDGVAVLVVGSFQNGATTTPTAPGPDVRPDRRPELAHVQLAQRRQPLAQFGGQPLGALRRRPGGAPRRTPGPSPAASTARCTSRLLARAAVRTFSSGTTRPSFTCRTGLTASAEPSTAAAAPIRPPRRRCSRVSTTK